MDANFWDDVYQRKGEKEVSWFQEVPKQSLALIDSFNLHKMANIIDIGGGDSRLVDYLIQRGFQNVTVLDISATALEKLKLRLADDANKITCIATDVTHFSPNITYQLWHDRAAFHFLTKKEQVDKYLELVSRVIAIGGYLVISTFSKTGPEKCSGLPICQYSAEDLKSLFCKSFQCINCFEDTHQTPWGSSQNFVYCAFQRIS